MKTHPLALEALVALSALVVPLAASLDAQVVDIAAGLDHSLALHADGSLSAWGANDSGQCDVPAPPPGRRFVEVAAGGSYIVDGSWWAFSLARLDDGSIVGWGAGAHGVVDVPPLPPGETYVGITAGNTHALALRSDGEVVAWGSNASGQCDVPPLPPGVTYTQVAAGGWDWSHVEWCDTSWPTWTYGHEGHSAALRSDGVLVTWGDGTHGQLAVPALPPGVGFAQIAAGGQHTAALLSDGSLAAWGANSHGQCDVTPPPPGRVYVSVDAGASRTVARLDDGTLAEWGGDPAVAHLELAMPPLAPGVTVTDLVVGGQHSTETWFEGSFPFPCTTDVWELTLSHRVAALSDGSFVVWGDNSFGQVVEEPWTDLGGGSAGVAGTPTLTFSGTPHEGHFVEANINNTPPSAQMLGWISFGPTPFDALGGTVHAFPYASQVPLVASVAGNRFVSVVWPASLPVGLDIWFQFVVQDGTVPGGLTLTNGVKTTTL